MRSSTSKEQGTSSGVAKGITSALSNDLRELDPAISFLRSSISGLGAALFDLEQAPALPLATGAHYVGTTAQAAKATQTALNDLWMAYPKLVAAMETVVERRGADDSLRGGERDAIRSLLIEPRVDLGGRTLAQEYERLQTVLSVARTQLDAIDTGFGAAAATLSELDAVLNSATAGANQTGERINEVARLAKQLAEQRSKASADPLGWHGEEVTVFAEQLRTVARKLGVVVQTQDQLDELIVAGSNRLDSLRLLIANGMAASAKARSRMADTGSLPNPLRVSVLDGADGLRKRLSELGAQLATDPRRARQLWSLWDRDMATLEASAAAILHANLKPIAERDALRGRLDGFEAKAGAAGLVESPSLVQLHRAAMTILTSPPVSLAAAEQAVGAYGLAVSQAISDALQNGLAAREVTKPGRR